MAQEFSYNNSKDNEPVTDSNIYEYLKASGRNPIEQYVSSWDYFRDNFNRYIMTFFSAAQDFTSYHNL